MDNRTPHLVQYQGSKRKLAPQILQYMPDHFDRLIEPFSGMMAITIAVANCKKTDRFVVNDLNEPIIALLREVVENADSIADRYEKLWNEQFEYGDNHVQHYKDVRDAFNNGEKTPEAMLYLLARVAKGAVRYGRNGSFNQIADKRRHGTRPETIRQSAYEISALLKGKTDFYTVDYRKIFDIVEIGDIVYMDPPYQGVSNVRDNRYLSGLTFDEFAASLEVLNSKGVDFIISYDGNCGEKTYGRDLPQELDCKKILLNAGISSQMTLLGKKETTYEALYLSRNLIEYYTKAPVQMCLEFAV